MTSATPTFIPILHGRYRIEEKLGTGRLAVVYRAYDERLQRTVLLHMLRKELMGQEQLRQRFLQEAHTSARRSHQSLLEVFDSGEVADRPYMITEYVTGRTIREIGALSLEEALLYFRQVVGAVAACQTAGVPHPPISSNNLILVADGHVELLENWQTSSADITLDMASYRAPERTEGQPVTPASAVYALGLLLFEMLTGRRAVTGTDPREVARAHLSAEIPPLSQVRRSLYVPSLEQLLQRMTSRHPAQRPRDAMALGQELEDLRRTISGDTKRLATPAVPPQSLRQRINRTANELGGSRPRPRKRPASNTGGPAVPLVEPAPEPLAQPDDWRARDRWRSLRGIAVLMVLFVIVAFGTYYFTSVVVERLFDARLPRPEIIVPRLPDLGIDLPEWLTGVVSGQGQVLVVTGTDALRLRAEPGTQTETIGVLPSGARVRRIGGPQLVNNIPWLKVRATVDGRDIEGWLSGNYVKTETGESPIAPQS